MDIYKIDSDHVRKITDDGDSVIVHFRARPSAIVIAKFLKSDVVDFSHEYCGEDADFNTLLGHFNDVLEARGFNRITASSAPNTYAYLEYAYNMAVAEWEDPDSDLFKTTTYPELYDGTDYRGSNTEYNSVAKNAMTSWILAMCLAEIVPSTAPAGTFTNNQTEIYKYAYNCVAPNGNGKTIPLYGGFEIHSDPMIARLAAGAVYERVRNAKTFAQINALRQEVYGDSGNHWIDAYDWDGLGYSYTNDKDSGLYADGSAAVLTYQSAMTALGFAVNTDAFLPGAPGPFVDDDRNDWVGLMTGTENFHLVDKKTGGAIPSGQPAGQFNDTTKNYLVDENIDRFMVQNYNLGKALPASEWNDPDYTDDMKNVVIDAATAPRDTDRYFYGDRINVQCTVSAGADGTNYDFSEGGAGNLYIEGPLSMLADVYKQGDTLDGGGYTTATGIIHRFLKDVKEMFDNSRFPTFHNWFGRRRPCMGESRGMPRDWSGDFYNSFSKENGIYNPSLSSLVADSAADVTKFANDSELVTEQPKSYPSGHSAMAWGMAMLIGQILPDRIAELMPRAYKVGVGRTVSRYHWNSDAIYGRLFATMMLPVINAMNGTNPSNGKTFQESYDQLKNALNASDSRVVVRVTNSTSGSVTIENRFRFVLVDDYSYNRTSGPLGTPDSAEGVTVNQDGSITIGAGKTAVFRNAGIDYAGYFGRSFLDMSDTTSSSYQVYILGHGDHLINTYLYDNATGNALGDNGSSPATSDIPSSRVLTNGDTYDITIFDVNP